MSILFNQLNSLPSSTGLSWKSLIEEEFASDPVRYGKLDQVLDEAYADGGVNPTADNIFRAFRECPIDSTSVVICGQDPYPNASHACGLAFSVPGGVRLPPSLKNILKELQDDVGGSCDAFCGDLGSWARQGVLLLNTALTVEEGKPNSHKALWGDFSANLLRKLNERSSRPLVFVMWGNQARDIGLSLEGKQKSGSLRKFIYSVHPSPLSAYRGFFGSKPFSQVNDFLRESGSATIDW